METVELKKLWNTLAEKQLIDQDIAKENILEIITKKGNGIIGRMKRKISFDYNLHLFGVIFLPLSVLFVIYWNNLHTDHHTAVQMGRTYTILALIEAFIVIGFINAIRNRKFLDITFNTGSIKESMENVQKHLKAYAKKAKIAGLVGLYSIFIFILVDIFLKIEGLANLNFSTTGSYIFETYFAVFVVLLMLALPSIVKFELRRFTRSIQEIDQTLLELKEED